MKLRLALFAGFFLTLFLAAVQESMVWMAVCTLCLTAFVVSALARPAGGASPSREQRSLWRKYREIVSGCGHWRRGCLDLLVRDDLVRGLPDLALEASLQGPSMPYGDLLEDVMLDMCMSGPRPGLSHSGRAVVEGMMLARAMYLCADALHTLDVVYPTQPSPHPALTNTIDLARTKELALYDAYRRLVSEGKLYQR